MSAKISEFDALKRKKELEDLRKKEEELLTSEPRKLWQSIDDLNSDFSTVKARRSEEFSTPVESQIENLSASSATTGLSRRRFLQFSAAASALISTVACTRRPVDHLVPYVKKPQGLTYGVPMWYATSSSNGYGVLVKAREGKPIKLEGNPDHAVTRGGLDAVTQASLFDLYNPDRLKSPVNAKTGAVVSWGDIDTAISTAIGSAAPGEVRVLTGPLVSPSYRASLKNFLEASKGQHHVAEDVATDPLDQAAEVLTGRKVFPTLKFDQADVVVSIDADFLGTWIRPLEFTKSFSQRRKIHQGNADVSRLYVFESLHTVTGIAADHRWTIRPSQSLAILLALGAEVTKSAGSADAAIKSVFGKFSSENLAQSFGFSLDAVKSVAKDLLSAKGKSLVVAGGRAQYALETQLAALMLNSVLGNLGSTVDFARPMVLGTESGASLNELIADMEAGKVKTLIIRGVNPVYSSEKFAAALKNVPNIFTLTSEMNETSAASTYALAESHYLESWGDSEIRSGYWTIQQPVIEPIYASRSLGEALQTWSGAKVENYRSFVQSQWQKASNRSGDFNSWWIEQLKNGGASLSSAERSASGFKWSAASGIFEKLSLKAPQGVEVVLYESIAIRDGSHANNPYLQELPDPVTKVTWDNYVGVSPSLAAKLDLNRNKFKDDARSEPKSLPSDFNSDLLEVTVNGKSIVLPVVVQAGLDANVVVIALGYGRKVAGSLGADVGQNAFPLVSNGQLRGMAASLKKVSGKYELACTQKQFDLQGRDSDILHQYTMKEFKSVGHAGEGEGHAEGKYKQPHVFSMYDEKEFVYPGQKWGMVIDLNSCTGCNACVVACYTENNVSTVGADQIRRGRHQAWLRLDLYHSGNAENPESAFEPMLCQHCDTAPCETVCPVLATVHSSDGLNDMSYNRCVGTRYCANNCPYKVRRFNWFQYSDKLANEVVKEDPLPMMLNPDVSVRTRGVMEKCTFCVQRIRTEVKSRMERVVDGHIKTACQQSCPADAIVFGDLNDPQSRVAQLSKAAGGFKVLELLNTRPSVTYLPRIRNKDASV